MVDRRSRMQRSYQNASILILTRLIQRTDESNMAYLILTVGWIGLLSFRGYRYKVFPSDPPVRRPCPFGQHLSSPPFLLPPLLTAASKPRWFLPLPQCDWEWGTVELKEEKVGFPFPWVFPSPWRFFLSPNLILGRNWWWWQQGIEGDCHHHRRRHHCRHNCWVLPNFFQGDPR
jgi:hypothetical protein